MQFQFLLYHYSPALLERLHEASSLRIELREVRGEWHYPTHFLSILFLKPFLVCCCLRLLGSIAVPNLLHDAALMLNSMALCVRLSPDLLLCSHMQHLGEMLLCLELHGLDEEPFPQEAEISAAKFSWKPAVEPYLQPQQKHGDFQAGYVQVAMILEHRLESGRLSLYNSHLIAGRSALQSLPTQPSPIRLQLDSVQKQGAVSLKEKAKKKSNYEHWNALNLWPTDLPVLSDEWRECVIIPWVHASQDVQWITTEFTTSQAALLLISTLQSYQLESTLETFPFHSSIHVIVRKQWAVGTGLAYQEEWESRYSGWSTKGIHSWVGFMHKHRDSLGLACHSNLEEKVSVGQKSWKRYKTRS